MTEPGKPLALGGERFKPIEKIAVTRQAVDRIRQMVLSRQLQPGEALPPERELAVQLGVSRSSLREAIRALELVNVLETRQGSGTFVTSLDPALLIEPIEYIFDADTSAILHLFEVRKVIETSAAEFAALRISPEELDEIDNLVTGADLCVDDPQAFLAFDFDIHSAIIEAAKNPMLVKMASSIARLSRESRNRTTWLLRVRKQAHEDHQLLAKCLRAGDGEAARQAMASHLDSVKHGYLEWLSSQPKGVAPGSGTK